MKNIHKYFLFLLSFILTGTVFFPIHAQTHKQRKNKNISLNITSNKSGKKKNNFNFGLMSSYNYLDGVSVNILSDIVYIKSSGLQISGFLNSNRYNSYGVSISGLTNITGLLSKGVRIGGLLNITGKSAYGVQIAGMGNINGNNQKGFHFSGLMNMSSVNTYGLFISGLANLTGDTHKGVAISGILNVAGEDTYGLQLASVMNVTAKSNKGLQLSALNNTSINNEGLQLSAISNYSAENNGTQAGIINMCDKGSKGVQIGIINHSKDSCIHQIGLVNLKPHTNIQMIISSGNLHKANIAVRFKNNIVYTQFGTGMIKGIISDKISISGIYRTGISIPLIKNKLHISTDMGFVHTETLKNTNIPPRFYSLQPRLNIEYTAIKGFTFFASGGYSWSRTYNGNAKYSNNPTFEAGVILF